MTRNDQECVPACSWRVDMLARQSRHQAAIHIHADDHLECAVILRADDRIDMAQVVAHARAMVDFDVLCLQEVAVNDPRLTGDAGFDQLARLRELLPQCAIVFGTAVTALGRQGQRQQRGIVIATRLPIAHTQSYPLPYPSDAEVRSMPRICTTATVLTAL